MNFEIIQIITPLLLLLLGGLGWLYKHEKQKRLDVEKQLSNKKYNVYNDLIGIFFEVFKNVKNDKKTNEGKIVSKMIDIKKEILIFGSDKVVETYFFWEKSANTNMALKSFS